MRVPSVVQLPGGIRLTGVKFRVVSYDAEGRPMIFEMLPEGAETKTGDDVWTLFADAASIRKPGRGPP